MKSPDDSRCGPAAHGDGATPAITVHAAAGLAAIRSTDVDVLRQQIAAAVRVLAQSGVAVARVHVEIVDDRSMGAFHERHSGVAGTTDVLTFLGSDEGEPIEVDIIACVDEAARRAAEFGHGVERELVLYAVHGLLHCCGHDDHDPAAYDAMHAEEDRILSAIGVGPTFRPGLDAKSRGAEGASR